jgi:hypothetical protein
LVHVVGDAGRPGRGHGPLGSQGGESRDVRDLVLKKIATKLTCNGPLGSQGGESRDVRDLVLKKIATKLTCNVILKKVRRRKFSR